MTAEPPVTPLGIRLLGASRSLCDGRAADARAAFQAIAADAPQLRQARYGLASAYLALGEAAEAEAAMVAARWLHAVEILARTDADLARCQGDPAYALQLADVLYGHGSVALASVIYGMAAGAGGLPMQGLVSYGLSLHHQGRAEEAISVFRFVSERAEHPALAEFLLPAHFPAVDGVARQAEAARLWGARWAAPVPEPAFANPPLAGRRLRVGYVGPSFVGTQARQFVAPLLDHHDPDAVQVFLYPQAEETADWLRRCTVHPIGRLADAAAAALIRADGIDVLVDSWGHNVGGRLPLFAHRPAPVQVTWLNYMQTTGVAAIDYTLHSDTVDQPDMQALFCERIWRMGEVSAPFRPDRAPSLLPTPMARNGYPTFASFNHPSKLTPVTISLWSAILRRAPGSRLVLKYRYFTDPLLQASVGAQFLAHGVDPLRLNFRGHSTGEDYAAEFDGIDLALDPTPAPGGTTSLEALAHGVPVLTLAGDTYYSRIGVDLLVGAGLPELVARSPADYVEAAVALTRDVSGLQALRDRVAPGFAAAPYRDEAAMARRFETTFRDMFELWRAGRPAPHPGIATPEALEVLA
jgi:protein O-GlcNAc transferase